MNWETKENRKKISQSKRKHKPSWGTVAYIHNWQISLCCLLLRFSNFEKLFVNVAIFRWKCNKQQQLIINFCFFVCFCFSFSFSFCFFLNNSNNNNKKMKKKKKERKKKNIIIWNKNKWNKFWNEMESKIH